jgi:uroporphyrinogen decarboxylase
MKKEQDMMPSTMTHWERVRAALKGEAVDRIPISLWRHWPVEDETAQGLAAAMIRWQQTYDFDLVKMMPTGTYGIEDWGAETVYIPNNNGTRTITKFGVTAVEQWPRLAQLDVTKAYLGKQIEAVRLTAEELKNSVPILQTVFSPLTTARKLAGDRIFADLRLQPGPFKEGLQLIAETTARFALESLRAGAHGLFFATQCATYRLLNEAEYREFGEYYDRIVLDAVRSEAELNLIHTHGEDIMFDLTAIYPVQAMNWHDRLTWPSLGEARQRFAGLLIGGINEWETLLHGSPETIRAEIQEAIAQTGGQRLLVGPGCVIPTNTPFDHIQAARQAVET